MTLKHSARARANMTKQLKAQLNFLYDDLINEQKALAKTKIYLKYKLPGVKSAIERHKKGIAKTKRDIANLKVRIRKRQAAGQINKIL